MLCIVALLFFGFLLGWFVVLCEFVCCMFSFMCLVLCGFTSCELCLLGMVLFWMIGALRGVRVFILVLLCCLWFKVGSGGCD